MKRHSFLFFNLFQKPQTRNPNSVSDLNINPQPAASHVFVTEERWSKPLRLGPLLPQHLSKYKYKKQGGEWKVRKRVKSNHTHQRTA